MKSIGLLILGLWLILHSAADLFHISFPGKRVVFSLIALIAGIILLIEAMRMRLSDVGLTLLGLWLIIKGSMVAVPYDFPHSTLILAALAILTGVLLTIRR